jgi:hypothetical protein
VLFGFQPMVDVEFRRLAEIYSPAFQLLRYELALSGRPMRSLLIIGQLLYFCLKVTELPIKLRAQFAGHDTYPFSEPGMIKRFMPPVRSATAREPVRVIPFTLPYY